MAKGTKHAGMTTKVICKLGTIAHNRDFSSADFSEYAEQPLSTLRALQRRGIVKKVGGDKYYPTPRGWKAIDRACRIRAGR